MCAELCRDTSSSSGGQCSLTASPGLELELHKSNPTESSRLQVTADENKGAEIWKSKLFYTVSSSIFGFLYWEQQLFEDRNAHYPPANRLLTWIEMHGLSGFVQTAAYSKTKETKFFEQGEKHLRSFWGIMSAWSHFKEVKEKRIDLYSFLTPGFNIVY